MLRRQQHRPEGENPEQTWDPRFEPVEQWRSSRICVRAKSRIGVEQEPGRIVGGCGPDEKQEHHVERNTPRTLDQLDQEVLGLRHQDEQRDACQEGSERHPNDPKNERKIKNMNPPVVFIGELTAMSSPCRDVRHPRIRRSSAAASSLPSSALGNRCPYVSIVITMDECPSRSCTIFAGSPRPASSVTLMHQ